MTPELLCKDCKHGFRTLSSWLSHGSKSYAYSCKLAYVPEHTELDPVTGNKTIPAKYESCNIARMSRLSRDVKEEHCGPEGKHWQPKHKSGLFKFIAKDHA